MATCTGFENYVGWLNNPFQVSQQPDIVVKIGIGSKALVLSAADKCDGFLYFHWILIFFLNVTEGIECSVVLCIKV